MDNAAGIPQILLADRDGEGRRTLEKFLVRAGWEFDFVADGNSALYAAAKRSYDVIITDLAIPGLHGLELLRAIREHKPGQAVIVVSALRSMEEAVEVLREGAADYLQKPVDFDTLAQAVQRIVSGLHRQDGDGKFCRHIAVQTTEYVFTSAQLAALKTPLPAVEQLYRAGRIGLEDKLKIDLALQEALANSLEHGNLELQSVWKEQFNREGIDRYTVKKRERLNDPHYAGRVVRITAAYDDRALTLRVLDGGPGFLPAEGADVKSDPVKLLCYGRGMAIIANGMDEISYGLRGTEIVMVKYLAPKRE